MLKAAILIASAAVLYVIYRLMPKVEREGVFDERIASDRDRQHLLNRAVQPFYPWFIALSLLAFAVILVWLIPFELSQFVLEQAQSHPMGPVGLVLASFSAGCGLGIAYVQRRRFVAVFDIDSPDVFIRQINWQLRFYVLGLGTLLGLCLVVQSNGGRLLLASLLAGAIGVAVGLCIRLSLGKSGKKKNSLWE